MSLMTANSPGPELRTATLMVMILFDDDGDDGDDDEGDFGDCDGDGDGIIIHDQLIHSRRTVHWMKDNFVRIIFFKIKFKDVCYDKLKGFK